jgi:hypothetical protein
MRKKNTEGLVDCRWEFGPTSFQKKEKSDWDIRPGW